MYVIRDVFRAKPGHAKELLAIFKETSPYFRKQPGVQQVRLMTDISDVYWTVIWEFEVAEIKDYFEMSSSVDSSVDVYTSLEGYKAHVRDGHREIFKLEFTLT